MSHTVAQHSWHSSVLHTAALGCVSLLWTQHPTAKCMHSNQSRQLTRPMVSLTDCSLVCSIITVECLIEGVKAVAAVNV